LGRVTVAAQHLSVPGHLFAPRSRRFPTAAALFATSPTKTRAKKERTTYGEDKANRRRHNYSRLYGTPSAAGGRTRPTSPATTAVVTTYGAIDKNGDGMPTLSTARKRHDRLDPFELSSSRLLPEPHWQNTKPATPRHFSIMILPKDRDPRFITIRRGGTLTDSDHRLLALWAAACAEHVLYLFESVQPSDPRPRQAVEQVRAWACGEVRMSQSRAAGGHAMAAARGLSGAARHAAYAAGQAAVVAHVAAHELGAAAYAIKAVRAAAAGREGESAGRLECRWQREQLPDAVRELVLDDQRLRNEICWSVFDF
jgi:hypothetical protein